MKTFLKLKKRLGEPIPMYLVPRKYGDWGLRKRPEKERDYIKGLFFPRSRAHKDAHPKTGYSFPEKEGNWIYLFGGRCRLGNESDEPENQEKDVVSVTYKNGQLVRSWITDENRRVIRECFYDDDSSLTNVITMSKAG